MARYVLGESAASRLKALLAPSSAVRNVSRGGALALSTTSTHPWQVRFESTVTDGDAGISGVKGGFLIAPGKLSLDGEDVSNILAANGNSPSYPSGDFSPLDGYSWYNFNLTEMQSADSIVLRVLRGNPDATSETEKETRAEIWAASKLSEDSRQHVEEPIDITLADYSADATKGTMRISQRINDDLYLTSPSDDEHPKPFDIERGGTADSPTYTVKRCTFYYKGEMITLADYDAIPTGDIWLNGKSIKQDGEYKEESIEWSIDVQPVDTTDGKSIAIKLYDISAGEVTCDYRGTFLTVPERTGAVDVDDYLKVVTDVEYLTSASDGDHQYQIRITKCPIVIDAKTGKLTLDKAKAEYSYIATEPLTTAETT